MLLIKGGRVIDPISNLDKITDVMIDGDRIIEIGDCHNAPSDCSIIDAAGLFIAPGLVDGHAHFREPGYTHKGDILSGAKDAMQGGYTSVVLMANTLPAVDNIDTMRYVLSKGEKTGINIHTCASVTVGREGKHLVDVEALSQAGAVAFSDDGSALLDEALTEEAMRAALAVDRPICLHEEDATLISENGINAGAVARKLDLTGSPREAEIQMVRRDLAIAEKTGAKVVFQHLSTAEAVELISAAKSRIKARGIKQHIFAEVTPHHLCFTEEAVLLQGTQAKVNPPLRTERDRQALIAGLRDGAIDMIATDHAPHAAEEKALPFTEAPSGMRGLATALTLCIKELVKPGYLSCLELIAKMSAVPAAVYGLPAGRIAVGESADLVIFADSPRYTIARGRVVYAQEENGSTSYQSK